jgi:gliding motility-associated protein GldM
MSGGKETPRQKMIGMMYLVLTALLALNISKEVLNGFVKVENGLQQTDATIRSKVAQMMYDFETKHAQNTQKVGPYFDAAKSAADKATALHNHITQMKARILATSNGDGDLVAAGDLSGYVAFDTDNKRDTVLNLKYIAVKDEYQKITTMLVGSEPQSPVDGEYTALGLKKKLEAFSEELKEISFTDAIGQRWATSEKMKTTLDKTFEYGEEMEDGEMRLWEAVNFYDVPVAAVIPLLSKIQIDIENAKADLMMELMSGIEAKSYKFTNLMPLVVPESNYILRGDTFRAQVLLAAYDGTNAPDIYVGDDKWDGQDSSLLAYAGTDPLEIGPEGLGELRFSTRGMPLGERSHKGVIRFQGPDGSIEDYPFYTPAYTVAEPALVVSPTKMNVFYRGLPNPVDISVPGVADDKLTVRITGGHKITKGSDGYVVEPGKSKEATITVSAQMPDGSNKNLPGADFRVKRIPDPVPKVAGKTPSDRTINKTDLINAPSVGAGMVNFDFDVKVRVKSFNISVSRGGNLTELSASTNRISGDMKELLNSCTRGSIVYIDNIVVSMPDGTDRAVAGLKLKVI